MDAQSGSRALGAAHDLVEMLRLAHGAAERLAAEVYGAHFEQADILQRELQRLRRSTERLRAEVERFVADEEAGTLRRGHPLRRAGERRANA
ncbi:MAG TPA: hypothetical protein VFI86_10180 [Burkholderiales bacterium]|nr:hypothetical protein [Burkholderiales bacterium]